MKRVSAATGGADGPIFVGLLARGEFSERGAHVGFVEHAGRAALEPAAREQWTKSVEILAPSFAIAPQEWLE